MKSPNVNFARDVISKTRTCVAVIFVEIFTESHKWMWQALDGAISATRIYALTYVYSTYDRSRCTISILAESYRGAGLAPIWTQLEMPW